MLDVPSGDALCRTDTLSSCYVHYYGTRQILQYYTTESPVITVSFNGARK